MAEIATIEELKELYVQMATIKSDKITKITDDSVFNGIAYASAKIAQKGIKDNAITIASILPDQAYGELLDLSAERLGVSGRLGGSGSSTWMRIVGDPDVIFPSDTTTFTSSTGIIFVLAENFTIPSLGYGFALVRSTTTGSSTNVPAQTINKVTPLPTGVTGVINDFSAIGGRDVEQDDVFRKRIKESFNMLALSTNKKLLQVFIAINNNVLDIKNLGKSEDGRVVISVVTQNGAPLTPTELSRLSDVSQTYSSLTDSSPVNVFGSGIKVQNIEWMDVNIDFRIDLYNKTISEQTRTDLQARIVNLLDFRFWDQNKRVEWEDILFAIKNDPNSRYVPDDYFYVYSGSTATRGDLIPGYNRLPRVKSFKMRDINGNIIVSTDTMLPLYFPNIPNDAFSSVV